MKLNQTQRNFIMEQITNTVLVKLREKGMQLTPKLIKQRGTRNMFESRWGTDDSGLLIVRASPNYHYQWAQKDVCTKKSEIKKQLSGAVINLPRQWYAEQFDAGHYDVDVDFGEYTCDTVTGPPKFEITWTNEKAEQVKRRKVAMRGLDKVIQETVEAAQFMHMAAVDATKFLRRARRKAMLTGVDEADDLLDTLEAGANKL